MPAKIFDAERSLGLLAESFRLYEMPGVEPPEPSEWGSFLLKYPQYLNGSAYEAAAHFIASDRSYTEEIDPNLAKLGGSLVAATFDQEQLLEIANT